MNAKKKKPWRKDRDFFGIISWGGGGGGGWGGVVGGGGGRGGGGGGWGVFFLASGSVDKVFSHGS